jgi:hypothetical protein
VTGPVIVRRRTLAASKISASLNGASWPISRFPNTRSAR